MGIARLILLFVILYLLYRVTKNLIGSAAQKKRIRSEKNRNRQPDRIGEELVEDPVCGTFVPISSATTLSESGRTVYFCSRECLEKYRKENR